ncbi:MAG: cation:proton antiporter [Candidatus Omnitrophota bacterium]
MNLSLSLGLIFLFGLITAKIARRMGVPAVTGYLLLGVCMGPECLGGVMPRLLAASGVVSNFVLGIMAFGIGQNFSADNFRRIGRSVIWISTLEAAGAWLCVTMSFWMLLGQPLYIAILFGSIAAATAPAATVMVVREYKAKGTFTSTLLGVVAVDDAWCLIIFAVSLALAKGLHAHSAQGGQLLRIALKSVLEIGGAFILGSAAALLLSRLSRFIRKSREFPIYTLGIIMLNIGLALHFHVSVLLASMFLGAVLVNIDRTSFRFFEALNKFDYMFYLLFFVIAGASLHFRSLASIGILGISYLFIRVAGKMAGAYIGAFASASSPEVRRFMGLGLVPQAGVALGCALIAKASFPEIGDIIFTTILATTIIYEIIGPMCTKFALTAAGDINP